MISPAKLDKLPSDMVNLVQELQEDIIRDVCRRFSKANYLTPTAEWQLYKANQLNLSYNEVNRRIARFLKVRERDVQRLYTDTVQQALKEDGDIYRIAAAMGKLPSNTGEKIDSYFRSAGFSRLLSKGLKNCRNGVRNLCNSMAAQVNRDLSDAMDYAHIQVLSGAFSPQEAIYQATKRLIESGLTRVEYPSGRRNSVDVCVRRAVRSSVNKSCCDLQLDLARELGSKYVEVTSYFGARPSHAEWQGQVFCLEKGDPTYPYFYEVTGYGTGEGLAGWNCGHSFSPFFPGIDTPCHSTDFSKEENNEYYALTQRQRALERAVRKSKQELAALDGARSGADDPQVRAKLDVDFARKSVTLKQREKRLDEFIKDKGLQRDNSRTRVVGFNRSVSSKASWAERKADNVSAKNYRNTAIDSQQEKGYNRFRKNHNTGNFLSLTEPMQMKHIKSVIKDMDIDYDGIEIDIIRDKDLIGKGLYGYTFPDGKKVQLYPDAFTDREQLVKTLGHERVHCEQVRLFGKPQNNKEVDYFEKGPTFSENYWWEEYKERTGYNGNR